MLALSEPDSLAQTGRHASRCALEENAGAIGAKISGSDLLPAPESDVGVATRTHKMEIPRC